MIRMYLPTVQFCQRHSCRTDPFRRTFFRRTAGTASSPGTLYILRRSSTCDRRCLFSSSIRKTAKTLSDRRATVSIRRDLRGSGKPDLWRTGSVYRIFCIYGSYENPQSDQNRHQPGTAPYSTGYQSIAACRHVPRSWVPKGLPCSTDSPVRTRHTACCYFSDQKPFG